jgi:hypothetical protein
MAELPESPSLEWLRKQAKRRLEELRRSDPAAKLADAQFELAKEHGFTSWRALKAHVDSLTDDGRVLRRRAQGTTRSSHGCSTSIRTCWARARSRTGRRSCMSPPTTAMKGQLRSCSSAGST